MFDLNGDVRTASMSDSSAIIADSIRLKCRVAFLNTQAIISTRDTAVSQGLHFCRSVLSVLSEIGVENARITRKVGGFPMHQHAAVLHDVGAVRDLQRVRRHLFDKQDRQSALVEIG
jgi:hypothetical protein